MGIHRARRRAVGVVGTTLALVVLAGCRPAAVITPGNPGPADVTFTIDASVAGTPISPLIYGSNSNRNLAANKQTVLRMGGNRWTAYNWENNYSNAGSDYCFQNDNYLSSSTNPGAAVLPTIDQATGAGAAAIVTVPILDYVAADNVQGCNNVMNSPDYLNTRFNQNKAVKGSAFAASPNKTDDFVYADEYVNWLKTNRPNATLYFSLDNEPDLWSATHQEIHPNPVTYAEMVQRNVDFAKAIKNVWPTANVTGPVNYGWLGMENLQQAPDSGAHGNFIEYYLDQMKAAGTANGKRLIDQLDVHYYSEATGKNGGNDVRVNWTDGNGNPDNSAGVAAAREQAPRSLWDPTYVESSWITNCCSGGAINLLPKMKARIAAHYPGTDIAMTEWNFGGGNHISGAIATADAFGIFGQQGMKMATFWELGADESFTYAAFRAFRNYDGAGSSFGNISVPATSSNVATATVYASKVTGAPNKTVIVAINKATTAKSAAITIKCSKRYTSAKVYTITAAGGANVVAKPDITPVATNAFNYSMPAQSVSIIVPQ